MTVQYSQGTDITTIKANEFERRAHSGNSCRLNPKSGQSVKLNTEHHLNLTYDGVLALLNAQGFDDHGDTLHLLLFRHCARQAQHGSIVEHLPHCQSLMQQVILQVDGITSEDSLHAYMCTHSLQLNSRVQ